MDFANYWFSSGEESAGGGGGEFDVTLFDSPTGIRDSIVAKQGPNCLITMKRRDDVSQWQWVFPAVGMDKMLWFPGTHDVQDYADFTAPGNYIAFSWATNEQYTGTNVITGYRNASHSVSVCKYQGTSNVQSIAHGLDGKPDFFFVRRLVRYEQVPTSFGVPLDPNDPSVLPDYFINNNQIKDLDDSQTTREVKNVFESADDSTVTVGVGGISNNSGDEYVLVCFRSSPGFAAIGSYAGNGKSSGPFIDTGFDPDMVILVQMISYGGRDWLSWNTKTQEDKGGSDQYGLTVNTRWKEGEYTNRRVLMTTGGFQITNSNSSTNEANMPYFYMAYKIPE